MAMSCLRGWEVIIVVFEEGVGVLGVCDGVTGVLDEQSRSCISL